MARFRMVVLGDSLQWGQGLLEKDKFTTLVKNRIAADLGATVILKSYARSGAHAAKKTTLSEQWQETGSNEDFNTGNYWGELGRHGNPTVQAQITRFISEERQRRLGVNLFLVDGGINDVGVFKIVDPATLWGTDPAILHQRWSNVCFKKMSNILYRIAKVIGPVPVVVTGYYPIFSSDSARELARIWLLQLNISMLPVVTSGILAQQLTKLSKIWAAVSKEGLKKAVDEANQQYAPASGLCFGYAHVAFQPENCVFASKPWLWGLKRTLTPEDPLWEQRAERAMTYAGYDAFDRVVAAYASVGHPNRTGAQQYYKAVAETLVGLGVLPA